MKRIVEIVPARPGWYARWRLAPESTRTYPVTIWALVEDTDDARQEVVGVDSMGQWPGGVDGEACGEFVRYLFQPPEAGQPDDAFSPALQQRSGGPAHAVLPQVPS